MADRIEIQILGNDGKYMKVYADPNEWKAACIFYKNKEREITPECILRFLEDTKDLAISNGR